MQRQISLYFLLTPQNSSGDLLDYELERIITFNLKMLTNCNFFLVGTCVNHEKPVIFKYYKGIYMY